jgi:hypothetical protein
MNMHYQKHQSNLYATNYFGIQEMNMYKNQLMRVSFAL